MTIETQKNKSGFRAIRLHYSVDPKLWPADRLAAIKSAIPGWRWRKEYEIDFSARGGQKVYDAFDPAIHSPVISPVDLDECLHYRVIDHGRRNPTACLWFAEHLPSNTVYFYREYYRPNATIAENCRGILEYDSRDDYKIRLTLIDPSTHRRLDNSSATIAGEYSRNGIPTVPADNNLASGIETVTSALIASLARNSIEQKSPHEYFSHHAIQADHLSELAQQTAVYFHPSMTNTIRELSQLAWLDTAGDEADKSLCEQIADINDHTADCVRYALRRHHARTQAVRTNLKKI